MKVLSVLLLQHCRFSLAAHTQVARVGVQAIKGACYHIAWNVNIFVKLQHLIVEDQTYIGQAMVLSKYGDRNRKGIIRIHVLME